MTQTLNPNNEVELTNYTCCNSAFGSFQALLNAEGGYRPSIRIDSLDRYIWAEAYDKAQEARGDDRRAYRYGTQDYVLLAKIAKYEAQQLMASVRAEDNGYPVFREVELIPVNGKGERDDHIDADFLPYKLLSGKNLERIEQSYLEDHGRHFSIYIGIDLYDSLGDMMKKNSYHEMVDYEPMYEGIGIDWSAIGC